MIRFVFVNESIEDELTTKELKRLLKGYVNSKFKVRLDGHNAYVDSQTVKGTQYNEFMGEIK